MTDSKRTIRNKCPGERVLNTFVNAMGWDEVIKQLRTWTEIGESRYVCLCNVHSAVTAQTNKAFASVLEQADLVLPDGMPIAWVLNHRGFKGQPRISGPDLMWRYCKVLEKQQESVFLYGSTSETLDKLVMSMRSAFPGLSIAGTLSPPFRKLSHEEELDHIKQVNDSGAHVLFVALGCPQQETWMLSQRGKINAVMLGLGAAFDFHAGTVCRAPTWMQKTGLEWFHRLLSEPKRLWKRYLVTNSRFIFSLIREYVRR